MQQSISDVFFSRLPKRPHCANTLTNGLLVRDAKRAAEFQHIQPNPPKMLAWLVFDLDYEGAAFAWENVNLPPPTITVINPASGHAHLYYGLHTPVCMSVAGREAPKRFVADIQDAFRLKLKADPGYKGTMAKNPLHESWRVIWIPKLYELNELAEWVSMPRFRKRTTQKNIGVGRNCTVFEELRLWAYKWVLEYKRNKASYTQWHSAVFEQAERLNAFAMPLPFGEIKHLVKSVAKWTWRTFTAEKFSAIQSARGKRGGRPKTTTKNGEPWSAMGVSKSTYYRKRKSGELAS